MANITGTPDDDELFDTGGDDFIESFAGDDTITVHHGTDSVTAGTDDDHLIVEYSGATTPVNGGLTLEPGGYIGRYENHFDSVVNFRGVERFTFRSGSGNDGITTGVGNDVIITGGGNDHVNASAGDDYVDAGAGDDVVNVLDGTDHADGGADTDGLFAILSGATSAIVADLSSPGAWATPAGTYFAGFEYLLQLDTGSGDDTIVTLDLDFDEVLQTAGGNDTITVRRGHDTVRAGAGNDHLIVDFSTAGAAINASLDPGSPVPSYDGIFLAGAERHVEFHDIERFTVTGGAHDDDLETGIGNDVVAGGAGNDGILAGAGADALTGGTGDDIVFGEAGDDVVIYRAGDGQDISDGGEGDEALGDRQIVNGTAAAEWFNVNPLAAPDFGVNIDTGNVDATLANAEIIGRDFEHLEILTGDGGDFVTIAGDLDDFGFSPSSIVVTGGAGADTFDASGVIEDDTGTPVRVVLSGLAGADVLIGGAADDLLQGGSEGDSLDGGAGADTMSGGTGDDVFFVNHLHDTVQEGDGEGTDTVHSSVTHFLSEHVENLVLTGSGEIHGVGNALPNSITANFGGRNDLYGLAGNDVYYVKDAGDVAWELADQGTDTVFSNVAYTLGDNVENLVLTRPEARSGIGNGLNNAITGNALDDALEGLDGNDRLKGGLGNDLLLGGANDDTLLGGAGADDMRGGAGNDVYEVDDRDDTVTDAEEGIDLVNSSVSFRLSLFVENLVLTGAAAIDGAGNDDANVITGNRAANFLAGHGGDDTLNAGAGDDRVHGGDDDDLLNGAEGDDHLAGGAHEDRLYGGAGSDILDGEAGDDLLNGGPGADAMAGGEGNDLYYVDDTADAIAETPDGGTDVVYAVAPHTLSPDVENLVLTSALAQLGSGNALGNVITGNTLDDVLTGAGGNDVLKGGLGNDTLDGGADSDMLRGGGGDDTLLYDAADVLVNGEAGADTLRILGRGTTLDLTLVPDTRIRAVEIVDLTGSGDNHLVLGLSDVIAISPDAHGLRIDGDGDDTLTADAGWTQLEVLHNIGGRAYHVYTNDTATLFVDTRIAVDFSA